MIIEIKYINDEVKRIEKIEQGDWIDLYSSEDYELSKGEFKLINLGVAMKLPKGFEAHMAPRSSTFKTWKIIQTNSLGIIDESYCGDQDFWRFPAYAMENTKIYKNDKICQFRIVQKMPLVILKEVKELGNPDRGGIGSTGRN